MKPAPAGFEPMQMTRAQLDTLMNFMAQLIVEVVHGTPSPAAQQLLMTDRLKPNQAQPYSSDFYFRRCGRVFYEPQNTVNPFMFGDTGQLLAQALHQQNRQPALTSA